MYKVIFATVVLFLSDFYFAGAVDSQWYWVTVPEDPATGYFLEEPMPNTIGYAGESNQESSVTKTVIPHTFMDAMELTADSKNCSSELDSAISTLREFDSTHEFYITEEVYCGLYGCKGLDSNSWYMVSHSPNQDTITAREDLIARIGENAQQCIDREQKEIQEAIEEQKIKDVKEKRLKEITEALENCDLEFFEEEMTSRERMETYDERMACKENDTDETPEDTTTQDQSLSAVNRADLLEQINTLMQLIALLQAQLTARQSGL